MKIGIDASRANKKNKTGVEWYSYYLIQEMKKITPLDTEVVLYTNEKLTNGLEDCPANFSEKNLKWPPKYLWTQLRLAWELFFDAPDVLFVPAHTIPFWPIRKKTKVYVTVHDVGFKRNPKLYKKIQYYYHDLTMRRIKSRVNTIITISDFSKQEIIDLYKIEAKKIVVIPLGYDQEKYNKNIVDDYSVLKKYKIQKPYILYVGRLERKKNIGNLIKAFAYSKILNPELKLVLAGNAGNEYEEIKNIINKNRLESEIILPGYIDEIDLPVVIKMAGAFVFPTLYEGFGLPILQSMAVGTPVITSDIEPHRWVAGGAAILVNPKDSEDMAKKINKAIKDEIFVLELKNRGFKRVEQFSWQNTAIKVLAVISQ